MTNQVSRYDLFSLLQKSCRRGDSNPTHWTPRSSLTRNTRSLGHVQGEVQCGRFYAASPRRTFTWRIPTPGSLWKSSGGSGRSRLKASCVPNPNRTASFTVTAVLYLCRSPKSRITDHAVIAINKERMQEIISEWRENPRPLVLPPYVYDGIHCSGPKKTEAEFILTENAVLQPRAEIDDPYIRQITSALNFH